MLAPAKIPESYISWNRKNGAPDGRRANELIRKYISDEGWYRVVGPFEATATARTRAFEYPWVFHMLNVHHSSRIVGIGGGHSGMQFLLSQFGHDVIDVNVGMRNDLAPESLASMNRRFNAAVRLETFPGREISSETIDAVFAISILEHLSPVEIGELICQVRRWLKPGGRLVLTVGLFLNLKPFTKRTSNQYGYNVDVAELVAASRLTLAFGNPTELYGFPEFDAALIMENLDRYLLGSYPVLKQCVVLEKQTGG